MLVQADQGTDNKFDIEEIRDALKLLKLNKSGDLDGLNFKFGGEHLKSWIKKILN